MVGISLVRRRHSRERCLTPVAHLWAKVLLSLNAQGRAEMLFKRRLQRCDDDDADGRDGFDDDGALRRLLTLPHLAQSGYLTDADAKLPSLKPRGIFHGISQC